MKRKLAIAVIYCVFGLFLSGCGGPGKGDVTGTITYRGQAVTGCHVNFFDEHNGVASDKTKEDGTYTVRGVATGTAKISIMMPMPSMLPGMPEAKFTQIPIKYVDREQSGLTYVVKSGPQSHDIELKD